jgi:hypothetical protein
LYPAYTIRSNTRLPPNISSIYHKSGIGYGGHAGNENIPSGRGGNGLIVIREKCPAGYICNSTSVREICPKGFYCPAMIDGPIVCPNPSNPSKNSLTLGATSEIECSGKITCPFGWIVVGSKCVKHFDTLLSWDAARGQCTSFGGELLTINNGNEYNEIMSHISLGNIVINRNNVDDDYHIAWIGYYGDYFSPTKYTLWQIYEIVVSNLLTPSESSDMYHGNWYYVMYYTVV